MASSRQTCHRLPAGRVLAIGRRLALILRQPDGHHLAEQQASRAFVSYIHARRLRARTPANTPSTVAAAVTPGRSTAQQGLSTSAGATTVDAGKDIASGSNRSDEDGNKATRDDAGAVVAGLEGKRGTSEAAAAAEEVPLDLRGVPRAKRRVDVELGTFHEFTAVNKNGGKIFEANRTLIPTKDATAFPPIKVSNLASDDCVAGASDVDFLSRVLEGRVTMVGLFHRQFGYSMLPTWTEPFEEAFAQPRHGSAPTSGRGKASEAPPSAVSLSLLESWPLRMLKPLLVTTMGRALSPEKKATFFYRFGPTEEVRKALGIINRLTLYVLLIDQKGRVRWQGTGKGTPAEIESLIQCARQLAAEGGGSSGGDRGGSRAGAAGSEWKRKKRGGASLSSAGSKSNHGRHRGGNA